MVKRVLFLCIGNSCRSPMAEGFARAYGADVIEPLSAGLAPADIIQPLTKQVMEAKQVNIDDQYAKDLSDIDLSTIDLLVNISGRPLPPGLPVEVRDWNVKDPIGCDEGTYITVRDQIERLVMGLVMDLRRGTYTPQSQLSVRPRFGRNVRLSR